MKRTPAVKVDGGEFAMRQLQSFIQRDHVSILFAMEHEFYFNPSCPGKCLNTHEEVLLCLVGFVAICVILILMYGHQVILFNSFDE